MDNILDTIIKISSALLTPTLAIVGAFILVNQFRLQKLRWRLDVYDKRYPVFISTMECLTHIVQHHNVSNEVLFKFLRGPDSKRPENGFPTRDVGTGRDKSGPRNKTSG